MDIIKEQIPASQETEKCTTIADEEVVDRIFTIPNCITFIRFLMIPLFFIFLIHANNLLAVGDYEQGQKINFITALIFALAAATDFLDGLIARKTHCVSRLGQLFDPVVDRLLMISGAVGVIICGRIPLWLVILILGRDAFMLIGGGYLYKKWQVRVPVIFAGKVSTTCLFVGLAGLLLYYPLMPGLGWVGASWLPFFSGEYYCWGILFIYTGVLIGIFTTGYYVKNAIAEYRKKKHAAAAGKLNSAELDSQK